MSAHDAIDGPFYHGTKARFVVGDLVTPGFRSNYGHGRRTSAWVYMSAILSPWAAELATGDGPGRIYVVEPTGPIEDDPDLTDKRFAGNPTKSYRSRFPLRVVGEVLNWVGHSEEEIEAMKNVLDRHRSEQILRIAGIPSEAEVDQVHAQADATAYQWASDSEYCGCTILTVIRGVDVATYSAMRYSSASRSEIRVFEFPQPDRTEPTLRQGEDRLSGRITQVTAWRDGWAAVLESCITEIGLSVETRIRIRVDAVVDTLTFFLDADGPQRSWQRRLTLVSGVLTDTAQGEIWDFAAGEFCGSLGQVHKV